MSKLLFLPFFALLFFGCDDASHEVDPLFYQISSADSARCMEEILDGILEEAAEAQKFEEGLYDPYSDIPYCGPRDIYRINLNSAGQLMVQNEIDSNNVAEKMYNYFMFNRNLTTNETQACSMNPSYEGFNYPYYNNWNLKEIEERIELATQEINEVKQEIGVDPEIVRFYTSRLTDWEEMKNAFMIIGAKSIKQIVSWAFVRVEFQRKSPKSEEVLNQIAFSFFQMRNYECLLYFNESYLSLYERAQRKKRKLDREKLDALEILHPARIYCEDRSNPDSFREAPPIELAP